MVCSPRVQNGEDKQLYFPSKRCVGWGGEGSGYGHCHCHKPKHSDGMKCLHCQLAYHVTSCKFLWMSSMWESGLESDTLVYNCSISRLHSLLPWCLSSQSLRKRRVHVVTRSIFLFERKPHPLIMPYHLIAPINTATLK